MKILVFGHGAVGSVLVKLLEKEHAVTSIVSADLRLDEKKSGKIHFVRINLKKKLRVLKLLEAHKPDVVINAASPMFNADILEACAVTGSNYMDLAACLEPDADKNSVSPYKIEQFDFDKQFRWKNIVGLIEAGVSPGMTNLFVRTCADEFDVLEDVNIRLVDYSGSDDLHFAWSKEALLDEINSKPLVYRNGAFKIMEPFSGVEEYEFPKPYGKQKVNLICQDEIGTIPFFVKLKNIDIKDYDNQVEMHKFLYKLGILSRKKMKFGDVEISPFDFANKVLPDIQFDGEDKKFESAQFAFAVEATGKIKRKKKTLRYYVSFPKQKNINKLCLNANFISYPTALSAKMFVMALSHVKTKGIIPPEALDKYVRAFVLAQLKKAKGVVIKKEWF